MSEEPVSAEVVGEVRKASGRALMFGILTMIAGVLALGSPLYAGGAVTLFVGVLLAVGGLFEMIAAMTGRSERSRGLAALSGLIALVAGVFLLARPLRALLTLTLLLAIYFVVDGIERLILAFRAKPEPGWGVCLFGGVVTLLLGFMIWKQWPVSGAWAIGTLVGIRLLFRGWTMVAMGSVGRALTRNPTA